MMLAEWLLLAITTCSMSMVASLPQPQPHAQNRFITPRYTMERRGSNSEDNCTSFTHHRDTIALGAGTLTKIGDGYNSVHCKQACLQASNFRCAAALIQPPASCFLTGYSIKDDYFSTHFERICSEGPDCFVRRPHSSAGFTVSVNIPWYFVQAWAAEIRKLYCMSHCEKREFCVGFDLRENMDNRTAHCVFLDLGTIPDPTFDLYVRRC